MSDNNDDTVLCLDCLNQCDAWEYEFGKPDCKARQELNPETRWGIPIDRPCYSLRTAYDELLSAATAMVVKVQGLNWVEAQPEYSGLYAIIERSKP